MPDRRIRVAPAPPDYTATLTADGSRIATLTASSPYAEATPSQTAQTQYLNIGWQNQAWIYYASIGPLQYGLNWLSNVMGRVALTIAEVQPGNEEPEVLEDGPAVEILQQLKWDESAILANLTIQLSVPGRGYLVGREITTGIREWKVYSPNQIRPAQDGRGWDWELWEYGKKWIPLANALVAPIRDSDDRFDWLDTSTVRGALNILREIDLYDREIVACLVSRLANNGLLLVPSEVTFPTREQFNDNSDPFMGQLIEAARQSIKDPGSASAAIPIPLKVPAQFIEKFRHLTLNDGADLEKIVNDREKAYGIMADSVNLPKEIIMGMGDVNHSSGLAQDLEDSAIKMHIAPVAELICRGLTRGFLYPQLTAAKQKLTGPSGGRLVVWFDPSALAAKPDKSDDAIQLYDRDELSGAALRRETGFTEEDAPTPDELRTQMLIKAAKLAAHTLTVIEEITGSPVGSSPEAAEVVQDPPPGNGVIPGDEKAPRNGIKRSLAAVQ